MTLDTFIPLCLSIVVATNLGSPIVGSEEDAGRAYVNICKRIMGEEVPFDDETTTAIENESTESSETETTVNDSDN